MMRLTTLRGITGNAVFRARSPGGNPLEFYWNGPGARIKLFWAQLLISIEHPTADGIYYNLRDARTAVVAYVGSIEQPGDYDGAQDSFTGADGEWHRIKGQTIDGKAIWQDPQGAMVLRNRGGL